MTDCPPPNEPAPIDMRLEVPLEERPTTADGMDIGEVYADLGGVPEIAADLGVNKYRVRRWIERRASTNCPLPVRELFCGNIYSKAEWRGWFRLWRITRGSETWWTGGP